MSKQRAKTPASKPGAAKTTPGKGRPTPKQGAPRPAKKRPHGPAGRPDGPLARRRRLRIRILVALLLVVNVVALVIWRDWRISLAVLIVSLIASPLLAAALLRRK